MILRLIGKFLVIAFLAGLAAWVPFLFYVEMLGMDWVKGGPAMDNHLIGLRIAMLGTFAVGLPIAIMVYFLARDSLVREPRTLLTIALLSGVMIALTGLVLEDVEAAWQMGLPTLAAAGTFAALGYIWIIKPMRESMQ